MAIVTVIVEDKIILVDGDARECDRSYPANLWAIQWDGTTGTAEWTDGPSTTIEAADVAEFITSWEAEAPEEEVPYTAQELINGESLRYLSLTDWYVIRFSETGVAVPSDIASLRVAARAAII